MIDVLCVGILVADCIAKPVTRIPEKGKLELVDNLSMYTGGCASSCSIDMAKLGIRAGVAGKIGNDGFGRFMRDELDKHGVDTSALAVDADTGTSASLVLVSQDGERSFVHCLGANGVFTETDICYGQVEKANIVFVAGTMLMPAFDGEPCARFLNKCKKMGKITALDTAWDSRGRWMEVLEPCMPYIDYFLPSYDEAVELSGGLRDPEAMADRFLAMGPFMVAIKLGKDGCFVKAKDGRAYTVPTFERIKAVDTTGAGDAFCAGFLTALTKGEGIYECGRFANAVGTHCVMASGASTGIRSRSEILRFISDYEAGLV